MKYLITANLCYITDSLKSVRVYRTESDKMINPIALRKAKIVCNFGISECSRVKMYMKIQNTFTRPNESLPDMSGGQMELRED